MKRILVLIVAFIFFGSLVFAGGSKEAEAEKTEEVVKEVVEQAQPGEPQRGGILRVAIEGEPAGLDTAAQTGTQLMRAVWSTQEYLFDYDESYKIVPQLAERWQWDSAGTIITFYLKKGVQFHNGKEMKAEDVLASWERGREMPISSTKFEQVANMEVVDPYTFKVTLITPTPTFLDIMAGPVGAVPILPADIARNTPAGRMRVEDVIGTGPYKLTEWRKGAFVRLVRFEDYVGDKEQYPDEIHLVPVTEVSARFSGVLAGDYDIALTIPVENYSQVLKSPNVVALKDPVGASHGMFLNHAKAPIGNLKVRQAMLAALDMGEILQAVVGEKSFYSLDSSWVGVEGSVYQTDMGNKLGVYNQKNPEKAKQLLKEAGYNNEPIILMPIIRKDMLNAALVVYEQLKAAGFNAELTPYDNAVVREVRSNPDKWSVYFSGIRNLSNPFSLSWAFNPKGYMHYSNATIDQLWKQLLEEPALEKRVEIWAEIEKIMYEDIPMIKYGSHYEMHVISAKLGGWRSAEDRTSSDLVFYNAWLKE